MSKININDELFYILSNLGLENKEILIYVACLELGQASVQDIAKKTGIKRVSIYNYIEPLKQKGFIAETKRGNRRLIVAENPKNLALILERKKFELSGIEKQLPTFINGLEKIQYKSDGAEKKINIRYYEGIQGVLRVYDEIFLNYTDIRAWVSIKNIYKSLPVDTLNKQIQIFKTKGTRIKEIIEDSKDAREYIKNKGNFKTSKLLPKKYKFPISTDFLIFEDNLVMITGGKKLAAVYIKNYEIAKTQRQIFDLMWKLI